MAVQTERGIPLSALSPKFLHSNSTSHTWPFSAIAELIDNAYDPDVSARQFWIDKTRIRDQDCLTFMDNGAGMDYDKMYKMLSFGFSDKVTKNGHVPIGLYGNGFKSGSMRLGKDAIVFSKNGESMCVGMLSQTYLQEVLAENIIVPIVTFKLFRESIRPESLHAPSLQDILRYSLFKTEVELLAELEAINTHGSKGSTGTRIIIWNLRKTSTDKTEFDFETDRYNIQIPADVYESEKEKYKQSYRVFQSSPESDFSLRAYCSVLYLKPRMQINIRGQKVKTQLIAKSLARVVKNKYQPNFLNKKSIPIIFGYNTKSKEQYGVMMYHRNRLIKAYERVGCQNRANSKGVGVIAVIECNFLKPTHNKQDFDNTDEYRRTIHALGVKLEEYWKAIRLENGLNSTVPVEDIPKRPDQNWAQCDECQKWRKLPDGIDMDRLPDKWFCRMNPDTERRGCEKPEEPEDSDDETSTCLIKLKLHEKNVKKQQEQEMMQREESRKQEQQRNAELKQQNEDLKRRQEDLLRKLHQKGSSPSRTPTASTSGTDRSPVTFSPFPQSENMPVITEVTSLSPFVRNKRGLERRTESQALKKARLLKEYCNNTANSPSTSKDLSDVRTSQMEISDDNVETDDVKSNADDDIVIDENKSTPRPNVQTFDLAKVKLEGSTSNDVQDSDPVSMETSATEASEGPSISNGQVSMTTQTYCGMSVKMEEDQQRKEEVEMKREETENDRTAMEQSSTEVECRKDTYTEMNRSVKDSVETERCNSADILIKPSLSDGSDRRTGGLSHTAEERFSVNSPLNIYNVPTLEAQEQQDSLLELLAAAAQERDEFKLKAQSLALELEKKEFKVLELMVKKDFNHQNVQTEPVDEKDYKTLYSQATQHNEQLTQTINELKKKQEEMLLLMKAEKEAQDRMKAQGAGPSTVADVEDEMALQTEFLLSELDQRNTECHELKSKLECVEQERARYEQMEKDLDEIRKNLEDCRNATASSATLVNQIKKEEETNESPIADEITVTKAKLRELRRSVARLLVTFVPALDPDQVNYECEVIDEILDQVLLEIPPS
ncbi:MORC family CW-type zinc finger protein 3a isoform X1 [Triplophysa dalaica]|uniref:MORC family CW-type zinc finger protein 3a isoform X1 n=1 Tax=Triplophysa dalaica TaxID=1582913 RepID=UPI0024DFC2B9|nr:MORC family CW-type zinc finger protein 3a isoform X1 [Triplophysa dalaica]